MGLAMNKIIPVGVVVKGVPSLDTKGRNGINGNMKQRYILRS